MGEVGQEGLMEEVEDAAALLGAGGRGCPDAFAPAASGLAVGKQTVKFADGKLVLSVFAPAKP